METQDFTHHISKKYNTELETVRALVQQMGQLVSKQFDKSIKSIITKDEELAKKVIKKDLGVNALEVQIDELCTQIIATRQPTATDLRLIIAVIKSITDLERIGDGAANIAKLAIKLADSKSVSPFYDGLKKLAEIASKNLINTVENLKSLDDVKALENAKADELVNTEFDRFNINLRQTMFESPEAINELILLNWVSRAIERIGDHSKNICEYIIYLVKGKDIRHLDLKTVEEEYFDET